MDPTPTAVIFFANGLAAVFSADGRQMPKYQKGRHRDTIRALEADGIDWRTLNVTGRPHASDSEDIR